MRLSRLQRTQTAKRLSDLRVTLGNEKGRCTQAGASPFLVVGMVVWGLLLAGSPPDLPLVLYDSLGDLIGDLGLPTLRVDVALFLSIGDEADLNEDAWHGSLSQHQKARLAYSSVVSTGGLEAALDQLGKPQAILQVLICHELEDDVRLA